MTLRIALLAASALCTLAFTGHAEEAASANAYAQVNFVANSAKYKATIETEPKFINAWGIAIRPAGKGGHFWVTASDVSYEYVGDVQHSPDAKMRALHVDELTRVKLPVGGKDNVATGTVFSDSKENFIITQPIQGTPDIVAPAKFLFASDGGIVSAWTERKKEDGTFDRSEQAIKVIDESEQGAQFFGLALSEKYDRLYVADFGAKPAVKVYDGTFKPAGITFDMPFDTNKNGVVDPGEFAPFNVQALKTPAGASHIFVTYAMTQPCPAAEIKTGACKKGELFAGEEFIDKPGQGRLAEFTEDGKLVSVWKDNGKLSAPWGLAFAPNNFGALSDALLVSNFGDGTIAAFDPATQSYKDAMRDTKGKVIKIDKIWGLIFGNGENLGDSNALYFAAGPDDEKDGVFGSLRVAENSPK